MCRPGSELQPLVRSCSCVVGLLVVEIEHRANRGAPVLYFDVLGNRASAVLHRSAAAGGDVTSTYVRPVSGESSIGPHAVSSVTAKTGTVTLGSSSFAYDAAGGTRLGVRSRVRRRRPCRGMPRVSSRAWRLTRTRTGRCRGPRRPGMCTRLMGIGWCVVRVGRRRCICLVRS